MGQYSQASASSDTAITSDYINQELGKLATAHNTHETGDFPVNSVPNTALVENQQDRSLQLIKASVGSGQAVGTVQTMIPIPEDCTLTKVKVMVTSIGSGGTHQVDIYDNQGTPASVLTGPITVAASGTVYSGTISGTTKSLNEDDFLSLRCITPASTGAFTEVNVVLYFKDNHTS